MRSRSSDGRSKKRKACLRRRGSGDVAREGSAEDTTEDTALVLAEGGAEVAGVLTRWAAATAGAFLERAISGGSYRRVASRIGLGYEHAICGS